MQFPPLPNPTSGTPPKLAHAKTEVQQAPLVGQPSHRGNAMTSYKSRKKKPNLHAQTPQREFGPLATVCTALRAPTSQLACLHYIIQTAASYYCTTRLSESTKQPFAAKATAPTVHYLISNNYVWQPTIPFYNVTGTMRPSTQTINTQSGSQNNSQGALLGPNASVGPNGAP